MPRYLRLDPRDLSQVRILAELEGEDPDQAVRDYIRAEHAFYDLAAPLLGEPKAAGAPQAVKPKRTPEGVAVRRAASRNWWRLHGAAYRAARKVAGHPLPGGRQYRQRSGKPG